MDSLSSVDGETPDGGATYKNGSGSEGEGLEDIGAASNAAIDVDFAAARDGLHDFRQGFDAGDGAVKLAASVVGDDDACNVVLDGDQGVFGGQDAFEQDGEL